MKRVSNFIEFEFRVRVRVSSTFSGLVQLDEKFFCPNFRRVEKVRANSNSKLELDDFEASNETGVVSVVISVTLDILTFNTFACGNRIINCL